jgi:hypothetical protein
MGVERVQENRKSWSLATWVAVATPTPLVWMYAAAGGLDGFPDWGRALHALLTAVAMVVAMTAIGRAGTGRGAGFALGVGVGGWVTLVAFLLKAVLP